MSLNSDALTQFHLLESVRFEMWDHDDAKTITDSDTLSRICHLCIVEVYPTHLSADYELQMAELALRKRLFELIYEDSKGFLGLQDWLSAIGIHNLLVEKSSGKTPSELLETDDIIEIIHAGEQIASEIAGSVLTYAEAHNLSPRKTSAIQPLIDWKEGLVGHPEAF